MGVREKIVNKTGKKVAAALSSVGKSANRVRVEGNAATDYTGVIGRGVYQSLNDPRNARDAIRNMRSQLTLARMKRYIRVNRLQEKRDEELKKIQEIEETTSNTLDRFIFHYRDAIKDYDSMDKALKADHGKHMTESLYSLYQELWSLNNVIQKNESYDKVDVIPYLNPIWNEPDEEVGYAPLIYLAYVLSRGQDACHDALLTSGSDVINIEKAKLEIKNPSCHAAVAKMSKRPSLPFTKQPLYIKGLKPVYQDETGHKLNKRKKGTAIWAVDISGNYAPTAYHDGVAPGAEDREALMLNQDYKMEIDNTIDDSKLAEQKALRQRGQQELYRRKQAEKEARRKQAEEEARVTQAKENEAAAILSSFSGQPESPMQIGAGGRKRSKKSKITKGKCKYTYKCKPHKKKQLCTYTYKCPSKKSKGSKRGKCKYTYKCKLHKKKQLCKYTYKCSKKSV